MTAWADTRYLCQESRVLGDLPSLSLPCSISLSTLHDWLDKMTVAAAVTSSHGSGSTEMDTRGFHQSSHFFFSASCVGKIPFQKAKTIPNHASSTLMLFCFGCLRYCYNECLARANGVVVIVESKTALNLFFMPVSGWHSDGLPCCEQSLFGP